MAIEQCSECGRVDDEYDDGEEHYCGCGGTMTSYFGPDDDGDDD